MICAFVIIVIGSGVCVHGDGADGFAAGEYWKGIIPKPKSYVISSGQYILTGQEKIVVRGRSSAETDEIFRTGSYFADKVRLSTGFSFGVVRGDIPAQGNITLVSDNSDLSLGQEGYNISITLNGIYIYAYTPEGLFRGVQTLRQMFPPEIELNERVAGVRWAVPVSEIRDQPVYEWRGMMLDVSRHFFSVETVKRSIDCAAAYKINIFHLHLTDDQGWRIEIKSWPGLAVIGGRTQIDGKQGGYFSQQDYIDIVKYAADRYIEIIPEIEMPAHINAALASYGILNPDGIPAQPLAKGSSTLMCRSEATWKFVTDVISEIAAITPGRYIHIGGDEATVTPEADYRYFIGRVNSIIESCGKKMIGWNPVQKGDDMSSETIVQYWVNIDKDISAAIENEMMLIMSPAKKAYLDMKYSPETDLGLKWAGYISVQAGYSWDPEDYTSSENILGVECPLWTETIETADDIDYMVYPRLLGYAEIGWTERSLRDWDDYRQRLQVHYKRMSFLGIRFSSE